MATETAYSTLIETSSGTIEVFGLIDEDRELVGLGR